jgi:predicted CopG family antitoxin
LAILIYSGIFHAYFVYMPSITITLSTEAHARLKKLKAAGDSFSDVILRELPDPCLTAGELLDRLESMEVPKADPKLRAAMLAGRGRSHRPGRK